MTGRPATRADRLRLVERLELADHASRLLQTKEEALERERVRLEGSCSRTREEWTVAWGDARRAIVRARMIGAADECDAAVTSVRTDAAVEVTWRHVMGAVTPVGAEVTAGHADEPTSTAAVVPAIAAARRAIDAAARHGVAAKAIERLDDELADTRRRRRAIDDRLRPRLEQARRSLDQHLEELEREDAVRVLEVERREVGS